MSNVKGSLCPNCMTLFAHPFDVCRFCGFHAHIRRGRICAGCGQYVPTVAEVREIDRLDVDAELAQFEEYGQ